MLNPPTTAAINADRVTRLAIIVPRTTTAAIIAQGTGAAIGPVGTATDGRAGTRWAGMVTNPSVPP